MEEGKGEEEKERIISSLLHKLQPLSVITTVVYQPGVVINSGCCEKLESYNHFVTCSECLI
jgi:hypothetical protein